MPSTTGEQRQMLAYAIVRAVVMHSSVEETVVYPAMRRAMGALAFEWGLLKGAPDEGGGRRGEESGTPPA